MKNLLWLIPVIVILIFMAQSCSESSSSSPNDCEQTSIQVSYSQGIKSVIPSGIYNYDCSETVTYSFELNEGYENLNIYFDGNPVPAEGSLSINNSHLLTAIASRIPTIHPQAESVNQALQELYYGNDYEDNYQNFVDKVSDLQTINPDSTMIWLNDISRINNSTMDLERVWDINNALHGKVFKIDNNTENYESNFLTNSQAEQRRTAIVFINGIWNTDVQAGISAFYLNEIAKEAGLNQKDFDTYLLYNRSHKPDKKLSCSLGAIFFDFMNLEIEQWEPSIEQCGWKLKDLQQAINQILLNDPPEDAQLIAQELNNFLKHGYQVIVVSHSQGNLMIRDAIERFDIIPKEFHKFIGVISLAAPASASTQRNHLGSFDCWIIDGDWITITESIGQIGCNNRLSSDYSVWVEKVFNQLGNRITGSTTWGFIHSPGPIALHSITQSYFDVHPGTFQGSSQSRQRLKETLYQQQKDLSIIETVFEPQVTTKSVAEITSTSAVSGGIVESAGVTPLEGRGVCWSTSSEPNINDGPCTSDGNELGEFESQLTNLEPGTEYFVRAYAINSTETGYGQLRNFTTEPESDDSDQPKNTVIDIDGNVYETVQINNQLWMAENLKTTRYQNGDKISTNLSDNQWSNTVSGAMAVYSHSNVDGIGAEHEMVEAYGRLYNWHAVDDNRSLCPDGWRIPSDSDWSILVDYVGGINVAHNKLRSTNTYPDNHPRWNRPNHGATDEVGFKAFPAGARLSLSWGIFYSGNGYYGSWWSSTQDNANLAWGRTIYSSFMERDPDHTNMGNNKQHGFSIRCIKN